MSTIATPTDAIDRFRQSVLDAIAARAYAGDTTERGMQSMLGVLDRAAPTARLIVRFSNPLENSQDAIEAFLDSERSRLEAEGLPVEDVASAEQDAMYCMGLAIGLALGGCKQ